VSELLIEGDDRGVVTLTLNRPQVLNAISISLERALRDALLALAADRQARAVILTGSGRAFSAGIDLKEAGQTGFGKRSMGDHEHSLPKVFTQLKIPVIGAINGFAITGGFELALMCDLLIASTQARFADTHARIGVVPGWGLSQRLPRLIGTGRAKELSLTGNYLDAETACSWVPTCQALAEDMASCHGPVQTEIKRLIDVGIHGTLADGLATEAKSAAAYNRAVCADDIETRRHEVRERGRGQAL
jgi:enoyl-CoA hydratase